MTYEQLIEHFGTQAAAARALGVKQPSVSEWKKNGIPEDQQLKAQKITKGKLPADPAIVAKYRDLLRSATGRAA